MSLQTLITEEVAQYLDNLHPDSSISVKELREETNSLANARWRLSSHACHFINLIIQLSQTKLVLEIGTFVGCSGMSIAQSLPKDGHLFTCDHNLQSLEIAQNAWQKAGVPQKITALHDDGLAVMNKFKENNTKFDLIFVDAEKQKYFAYYTQGLEILNDQGLMIFDNVLWHGTVADPNTTEKNGQAMREFNQKVQADSRVDSIVIPIGDGLNVIRKK
ncbi:MAG: class I SAM-dependent methyltransferase [Crocosphaera sp.]